MGVRVVVDRKDFGSHTFIPYHNFQVLFHLCMIQYAIEPPTYYNFLQQVQIEPNEKMLHFFSYFFGHRIVK